MPNFVLSRNFSLSSKKGHVIQFVKGQPTWVAPECVPEAIALGAECVDGPIDVLPPEIKEQIPLSAEEREELLLVAIDEVVATNNTIDFTGAGVPRVKTLQRISGINDIDAQEVQILWQKYREAKASQ